MLWKEGRKDKYTHGVSHCFFTRADFLGGVVRLTAVGVSPSSGTSLLRVLLKKYHLLNFKTWWVFNLVE